MTWSIRKAIAMVSALCLVTLVGCTGDGEDSNAQASKGGTLYVLMSGDFEHLDPQRNYVMPNQDFGRLIYRSLTTFKAAPGKEGTDVVPDLATSLGEPSNGDRTWTFTLKDGVKFEDGSAITSADVKYGVERSFAPELPEGAPWARLLLRGGGSYKGPYAEPGGLDSIETPDNKTIVFHLNRPVADFSYTAALPTFSPVPKEKDKGVNYDNRPFSSGPYKIKSYDRGKQMVLVRNSRWDKSTDTVRTALPDKVVVEQGIDPAVIDQRLLADQGVDQQAVAVDDILSSSISRVATDPQVRERTLSGPTGCTRYLALNTQAEPLDALKVRQAINYAVSKDAYRTARGGPYIGELATSILPPTTPGWAEYDLYPTPGGKGNLDKARQLLAEAGYPNGFRTSLTTTATDLGGKEATAIQQALAKVGIEVTVNSVNDAVYYTAIGNVKKQDPMVFGGWCPDWPGASTFIPPLFDGRTIQPMGNTNWSQYNDPEVNARIDAIESMTNAQTAAQAWVELDERIMQDAPIVPLLWDKGVVLHGSRVTGAYPSQTYAGRVDFVSLGVTN